MKKTGLILGGILLLLLFSGCTKTAQDTGNRTKTDSADIRPGPVAPFTSEELDQLRLDEDECSTGPAFVPKIKYAWNWSEIGNDFCTRYYCDAAQFSVFLLKKMNSFSEQAANDPAFGSGDSSADCSSDTCFQFEANLVKDGFGGSFQKDFDRYMREKNFADTPAFYLDGSLGQVFADPEKFVFTASEIGRPGKYAVTVRYSSGLTGKILVEFGLVSGDESANPFYYFPFDGHIGEDGKRDGYGLGIEPGNSQPIPLSDGLVLSSDFPQEGLFSAKMEWGKNLGLANAVGSRGTVLKLFADPVGKRRKIEFSPLLATPILLHSSVDASGSNSVALVYKGVFQNDLEMDGGNSFLVWKPVDQCRGYDQKTISFADAPDSKNPGAYMILQGLDSLTQEEKKQTKDAFFQTIVYSPDPISLSAIGTALDGRFDSRGSMDFWTPKYQAPDVILDGMPEMTLNSETEIIRQINDVFGAIARGDMCIQKAGDGQNLEVRAYWNEKKLYDQFSAQIDSARQQCAADTVFSEISLTCPEPIPTAQYSPPEGIYADFFGWMRAKGYNECVLNQYEDYSEDESGLTVDGAPILKSFLDKRPANIAQPVIVPFYDLVPTDAEATFVSMGSGEGGNCIFNPHFPAFCPAPIPADYKFLEKQFEKTFGMDFEFVYNRVEIDYTDELGEPEFRTDGSPNNGANGEYYFFRSDTPQYRNFIERFNSDFFDEGLHPILHYSIQRFRNLPGKGPTVGGFVAKVSHNPNAFNDLLAFSHEWGHTFGLIHPFYNSPSDGTRTFLQLDGIMSNSYQPGFFLDSLDPLERYAIEPSDGYADESTFAAEYNKILPDCEKADIEINSAKITQENADSVTIAVGIQNNGLIKAAYASLAAFDEGLTGTLIEEKILEKIEAMECASYEFTIDKAAFPSGKIYLVLDPDNKIPESAENNNYFSVSAS